MNLAYNFMNLENYEVWCYVNVIQCGLDYKFDSFRLFLNCGFHFNSRVVWRIELNWMKLQPQFNKPEWFQTWLQLLPYFR